MIEHVDTCVVGAGVVGLAIAKVLSKSADDLVILDQAVHYGQGISSRNSEVIHAGIYYQAGSLKALLCARGKQLLYDYCEKRHIPYRRCGKLIVATSEDEIDILADILQKARTNDVEDLTYWSESQLLEAEPNVKAKLGLFSPSTGIVSAHDLMDAYVADIEGSNGQVVSHTTVSSIQKKRDKFIVNCLVEGEAYQISCRVLVNAAGLGAQELAANMEFICATDIPPLYLCKGNYFVYSGKNPFNHLVYPVPDPSGAGLGIHATLDLGGQLKFGPDVQYIDSEDYALSTDRLEAYYAAIKRYMPSLERSQLQPGYVGIRPKLQGPGGAVEDFVIQSELTHGIEGCVQLFGIESPGLTASLAIGEYVADCLSESY